MIIRPDGVTDILFFKTNKEYQELCNLHDANQLKIKELEITKLMLERDQLDIEMRIRSIEETIAKGILLRS